jgi:hypothetical protein
MTGAKGVSLRKAAGSSGLLKRPQQPDDESEETREPRAGCELEIDTEHHHSSIDWRWCWWRVNVTSSPRTESQRGRPPE